MSYKRLIPCIFILGGKAVKWFDDPTVVSEDVIALAKEYSDNGADELLVFDLSSTDQDHDESIELMKKINRVIRIPMVAGGNVKRQEDVKKILYTGAKRAMLNFSKPDSQKLIESVSLEFPECPVFPEPLGFLDFQGCPVWLVSPEHPVSLSGVRLSPDPLSDQSRYLPDSRFHYSA
jgi:imidazole glycerol phosphate synthase subunit HisF